MTKNSKIAIVITAAGSSTRMGGGKKEYLPFKNGTVLSVCAGTFYKACHKNFQITDFIITCPQNGKEKCLEVLKADKEIDFPLSIVEGGSSRQESVFKGLLAIKGKPELVLIHDGARPFVSEELIQKGIELAFEYGASVPGLTPVETQKRINSQGFIEEHLVRSSLVSVQTPQTFNYEKLLQAHKAAAHENKEYTDDTEVWAKYNKPGLVKVYPGDVNNIKITYPADLEKL